MHVRGLALALVLLAGGSAAPPPRVIGADVAPPPASAQATWLAYDDYCWDSVCVAVADAAAPCRTLPRIVAREGEAVRFRLGFRPVRVEISRGGRRYVPLAPSRTPTWRPRRAGPFVLHAFAPPSPGVRTQVSEASYEGCVAKRAAPPARLPATTTLIGTVVLYPATPVCRVGTPCSRPLPRFLLSFARPGAVTTARTDVHGRYRLRLAPGTYTVKAPESRGRLTPSLVYVPRVGQARLRFSLDVGIR